MTSSFAQLQSELAICQRELTFSETELEAARRQSREVDEQHRRETLDLRNQVRDLSERVSTAYLRGSEEGIQAQKELSEAQDELGELCSNVMVAQAESEFAEALHATSIRENREANELRSRTLRAEQMTKELVEEREKLKIALPCLTDEIRECERASALDLLETQAMEEALLHRGQELKCYEQDFRELHANLRHVLETLRARYAGAQKEKNVLEERVASLERARSPRLAATRRMAHHLASLQGELLGHDSEGLDPWWGSSSSRGHVDQEPLENEGHSLSESGQSDQPIQVVEQPFVPRVRPAFRQPLPPRHAVREAARQAKEDEEAQKRFEQQLRKQKFNQRERASLFDEIGPKFEKPLVESLGRSPSWGRRSPAQYADELADDPRDLLDSAMSDFASPSHSTKRATIAQYDEDVSDAESDSSGYWQDPARGPRDDRDMVRFPMQGCIPR